MEKQLLDSIVVDKGDCLDTEEAIREKIQELNVRNLLSMFGNFVVV